MLEASEIFPFYIGFQHQNIERKFCSTGSVNSLGTRISLGWSVSRSVFLNFLKRQSKVTLPYSYCCTCYRTITTVNFIQEAWDPQEVQWINSASCELNLPLPPHSPTDLQPSPHRSTRITRFVTIYFFADAHNMKLLILLIFKVYSHRSMEV